MIRLPAALFALALFVVPLVTAPIKAVALLGLAASLLAAAGIVGLWRAPLTAAACVFLIDYAVALWAARAAVNVGSAVVFGLGLILLLESIELGRGLRRATVDARVIRSLLVTRSGLAVATLAVTLLGLALARGLVASIPDAAAPFIAALAVVGVVLALAAILRARPRV